jgi:hypothetical protein
MSNGGGSSDQESSLSQQIFEELGFDPGPGEMMGGFNSNGWSYRGVAEVNCTHDRCEQSQQHVWHRPEDGSTVAHWAIVCNECCRVSEISKFDMDDRELLAEAKTVDQARSASSTTLRVGFFCCGPCPEAVALIDLLNAERFQRRSPSLSKPDNYPLVLDVFRAIRQRNSAVSEDLRVELEELHDPFKWLRRKYRGGYDSRGIEIEYSGLIAEAYLLVYVPGYINQARIALKKAFDLMERHRRSDLRSPQLNIELHLFDLRTTGWSDTRSELLDYGCKQKWRNRLSINEHHFNLQDGSTLAECQETLRSLDIAMFQNFDNEIGDGESDKRNRALQTITKIAVQMPLGSQLVLSDLMGSDDAHEKLEQDWKNRGIGSVAREQRGKTTEGEGDPYRIHEAPRDSPLTEYFFSDFASGRIYKANLTSLNILVLNRFNQIEPGRQPAR